MKKKIIFAGILSMLLTTIVLPANLTSASVTLSDIEGHQNETAIRFLADNNIIHGYPDGTFRPDNGVNRAETLKLLFQAKGIMPDVPSTQCFEDVPLNEWYSRYVCKAKELGLAQGYPDGTFQPANYVNKVEAVKLVATFGGWDLSEGQDEALFADTDETAWYSPYLKYAKNKNLIEYGGNAYNPADDMPRGSIAETIFRSALVKFLQTASYDASDVQTYLTEYEASKSGTEVTQETQTTLDSLIAEEEMVPANQNELEHSFFRGEPGEPQLKTPVVEFSPEGTDMDLEIGISGQNKISDVRVLLYDYLKDEWGYAFNSQTLSSDPFVKQIDSFANRYTFYANRILLPLQEEDTDLSTVDEGRGFLIQADTTDNKSYLLGNDSTLLITEPAGLQVLAAETPAVPFKDKECTYPDAIVLAPLQSAFSKEGVSITLANLDTEKFKATMKCGETSETLIRLGSDLKVLESLEKIKQRIANNDFTEEEPAGKLIGAHYLLFIKVNSYCGTDCKCSCQVAYRLVSVETSVIEASGFLTGDCENLGGNFDSMLQNIENSTDKDIH